MTDPEAATAPDERPAARGGRWRAFLSAFCIVLAAVLVPVSILGAWARAELVDEGRFVATLAPLAQDPQVQGFLIEETRNAIDERVDFDQLTGSVVGGLDGLGLPPRAVTALNLLSGPAADGLRDLVDNGVDKVVRSDAFAGIWATAARDAHRALTGAQTADGGGMVVLTDAGIGVRLGPLVDQVRQRLADRGVRVAALIPAVDRTVIVGDGDAVVTVRTAYEIAVTAGWWLPVVVLGLLGLGIFVARRRSVAVLGSGVALALGGTALMLGSSVGSSAVSAAAGRPDVAFAVEAIYRTFVDPMEHTAVVAIVVGVFVAVLGWAAGDRSTSRRLRGVVGGLNADARRGLLERGLDTGAVGRWMGGHRVVVRAVVVALAVVWLALLRPLTVGDVVVVVVVALLAAWVLELLQQRSDEISGAVQHAEGR